MWKTTFLNSSARLAALASLMLMICCVTVTATTTEDSDNISGMITASSIPTDISNSASSIRGIIACAVLTGVFWDKVSYPSSSVYGDENAYWSATAVLSPSCIFSPKSAQDVSIAVKILVLAKVEFAIKGGGHTANKGWANTDRGVLISLSELDTLEVTPGADYVQVGAGRHWEEVYNYLDAKQLSAVGGRMTGVGVSGYLLGGGISYISNERGFGCDNVKNYQIVLADGSIVDANAQTNPDLFKALKGGTNNFGVVTRFDLYTYKSTGVYAGSLYYMENNFDALFNATANYAIGNTDLKTHVIPAFVSLPGYSIAAFYVFSSDPVTSPPAALQPFFNIPTFTNTARLTNFTGATEELGAGDVFGMRHYLQALTIVADASLYKDIYAIFKENNAPLTSSITGFQASVAYQPLGASVLAAGVARGGNSLGLSASQGTPTCLNFNYRWANTSDDDIVKAVANTVITKASSLAKSRGLFNPYIYLNYADANADVIESYGAQNVKSLQAAKERYDPKNIFGTLVKGGFKVPQ